MKKDAQVIVRNQTNDVWMKYRRKHDGVEEVSIQEITGKTVYLVDEEIEHFLNMLQQGRELEVEFVDGEC